MLISSAKAFSLLVCLSAAWAVPARASELEAPTSDSLDQPALQTSLRVPCHGCLSGVDDDALFLDLEIFPSSQPCGETDLRLNGVKLDQEWQSTHANGSGSLSLVQQKTIQDLELKWQTNCLTPITSIDDSAVDDSALVLTVTVTQVNGRIPRSRSGFTTSFKQYPTPELLRVNLHPVLPVPKTPAEAWRNPPSFLRSNQPQYGSDSLSQALSGQLQDLDRLRAIKEELERFIEAKEDQVQAAFQDFDGGVQQRLRNCPSLICKVEIVPWRVRKAFEHAYLQITRASWDQLTISPATSGSAPKPKMHSDTSHSHLPVDSTVTLPASAYFRPGTISTDSSHENYEKLPDEEPQVQRLGSQSHGRRRRNPFIAILQFLCVVFGLAALFAFIRRRCASLRTRTERAANREERRNRRAYRRAARRAAWTKWWRSGWGRSRDEERRLDYEEKRTLIQEQESRLEGAMADEIQNLRHAHGVVDELVRAEEGRGTLARPVIIRGRMPGMASIAGLMMGQHTMYSTSYLTGTTAVSETDDGSAILTPPTSATFSQPMSRSDSLPSYRTDPTHASAPSSRYSADSDVDSRSIFSDPPAYQTDPEDSDDEVHNRVEGVEIVTNGFTQYAPSEYATSLLSPTDTASIFTPDSSVLDVSPRESAETVRTFM